MSQQIDPRGQQFAAAVTSVVLVAVAAHRCPARSASPCSPLQAALFAIGGGRGVQRTPVAAAVPDASSGPRLGAPAHLEDPAPPRFAQGVGLVFAARRPRRLPRRGRPCSATSPPAFALVAALLNAVFGLCLGCEVYLLGRRVAAPDTRTLHRPHHSHHRQGAPHEPRELSRHRPVGRGQPRQRQHRPHRGRRGHHGLRQGPHQGRHQARLDDRPPGPGASRLRQQGAVRGAAELARRRQRRHRRALRRQQQLVRRLRLLVLQALRPRRRQAARRRPQEVGARLPRAHRRRCPSAPRRRTPPRSRTPASAPSATRPSRPSA